MGSFKWIPGSPGNPGLRLERAGAAEVSAFSQGARGAPRWPGCEGSQRASQRVRGSAGKGRACSGEVLGGQEVFLWGSRMLDV